PTDRTDARCGLRRLPRLRLTVCALLSSQGERHESCESGPDFLPYTMLEGASYGKTRVGGSTRGQPRRRRSRSSSLAARFGILVPGRAVPRDLRPSERGRYSPGSPLRGAPLLPGWSDAVRGGEPAPGM